MAHKVGASVPTDNHGLERGGKISEKWKRCSRPRPQPQVQMRKGGGQGRKGKRVGEEGRESVSDTLLPPLSLGHAVALKEDWAGKL